MVLLNGYASKRCARRVHNDFDTTVAKVPWTPPRELQERFDAGNAFEDQVFAAMAASLGEDFQRIGADTAAAEVDATLEAMRGGRRVVAGGRLPPDLSGSRSGKPDLLVRVTTDAEPPGYVPVDVKHHLMTTVAPRKTVELSSLAEPWRAQSLTGRAVRSSPRLDDWLQLAHYTRMLQACGFHATGSLRGAVIGSDLLVDGLPALVWFDLDEPYFSTYSRSRGKVKRSALERYDHEHDFRVRVAQVARRRTGAHDDPAPLVVPVWQPECSLCPHQDYCKNQLGPDNASIAITSGTLDVREWLALDALGVGTTTALAELDPSEESFQREYLPHVTHQPQVLARLEAAVVRATMLRDGEVLRRISDGPLTVPAADVEVDFDIEWDVAGRVYLWGAQVRRGPDAPATYQAVVSWDVLDDDAEHAVGEEFAAWLRKLIHGCDERGESVAVYHYTSPERTYLARVIGPAASADLLARFVDVHAFVREHFIGVAGLGIKKVAPAFGFAWHDEDPGGLQSQGWLAEARDTTATQAAEAARARLLRYNADDVAATAAIRDGLRASSPGD